MKKTPNFAFSQRHAIGVGSVVIIFLLIAILAVAVYTFVPIKGLTTSPPITGGGGSQQALPNKLAIQVQDPLQAVGVGSATVTIYPTAGTVVGGQTFDGKTSSETLTTSAGGSVTTGLSYPAGNSIIIKVSAASYVTEYVPISVPAYCFSSAAGGCQATPISVYALHSPTFSFSAVDGAGNSYSSGGNKLNFTKSGTCTSGNNCLGVSSTTLSFNIFNTLQNSGYVNSFDPVNNVNWYAVVQIDNGGTAKATIQGASGSFTVGTTTYYYFQLPPGYSNGQFSPGGITQRTVGTTSSGGSTSVILTLGVGSMVHGNTETLTFKVFFYADPNYAVANNGVWSPNAAQQGSSFTLTLAA